jgi:DNA-binding MarR family transcriptional regulator
VKNEEKAGFIPAAVVSEAMPAYLDARRGNRALLFRRSLLTENYFDSQNKRRSGRPVKEERLDRFNELLVPISTNLMLHEMNSLKGSFILRTLSFQEMHTIEIIGNLEEVAMGDLARTARVTQGTMSVMVKKLVNKGLVERAENPQDLRVVKVRLTQKGRDAYRQHKEMHKKATRAWLSLVSREEQEIMLMVLKKINRFLTE